MFEYAGEDDPIQEAPERIEKDDAYARLSKLFVRNTKLNNVGQQGTYSITNPPPLVRMYHL